MEFSGNAPLPVVEQIAGLLMNGHPPLGLR